MSTTSFTSGDLHHMNFRCCLMLISSSGLICCFFGNQLIDSDVRNRKNTASAASGFLPLMSLYHFVAARTTEWHHPSHAGDITTDSGAPRLCNAVHLDDKVGHWCFKRLISSQTFSFHLNDATLYYRPTRLYGLRCLLLLKNAYKHHLRVRQVCRLCDWLMQQESSSAVKKNQFFISLKSNRNPLHNPADSPETSNNCREGKKKHARPQAFGSTESISGNRKKLLGNTSDSKNHSLRM